MSNEERHSAGDAPPADARGVGTAEARGVEADESRVGGGVNVGGVNVVGVDDEAARAVAADNDEAARAVAAADGAARLISGAARALSSEPGGASRRRPLPPIEPLVLQPPFEERADGRYNVSELLGFHDRVFVEAAFAAALGRAADPAEIEATLLDLRLGRLTKLEIVESLAESAEGRAARAPERIEGVGRGGVSSRLRALPFVGHLWRALAGLWRLPLLMRHQQQLEAYTTAQMQIVADYINTQEHRIAAYVNDEVRPVISDAAEAVSMLSDALAAMRARVEEQQLRLDGQEEFLVQEKHEIVEAQKTALSEIEGRLRALVSEQRDALDSQRDALAAQSDALDAQRRALEELSARLERLRAAGGGR